MVSRNSLVAVSQFYLGKHLEKESRDMFITSESSSDIRARLQEAMTYCARDVFATYQVFCKVFPRFREKCPHPVSLSGILQMGSMFLPVTKEWENFVDSCQSSVDRLSNQIEVVLQKLALEALHNYIDTSKAVTWNGQPADKTFPLSSYLPETISLNTDQISENPWISQLDWSLNPLRITKSGIPHKNQRLPNYPSWFVELWDSKANKIVITSKKRVTPLLLELKWHGHPLIFSATHKWCFMVKKHDLIDEEWVGFPRVEFPDDSEDGTKFKKFVDKEYYFYKLPHKDGFKGNTGNPFSNFFSAFFKNKSLDSPFSVTQHALDLQVMASYWNASSDRIRSQMVVWQRDSNLGLPPRNHLRTAELKSGGGLQEEIGIILPKTKVMGTITRRAVEPTWMTASNAKKSRIGSDIKRHVKAPPGYAIIGADVDSEELWISSAMGDSQFGMHGSTALGWMTLQGTKADGTDLHSVTADILGISRGDAKQFNYARIYGAGIGFAASLLSQHNAAMSTKDANAKAAELYIKTKGRKCAEDPPITSAPKPFWMGGRESFMFNSLEMIALSNDPRTPILDCQIPSGLMRLNCDNNVSFLSLLIQRPHSLDANMINKFLVCPKQN
jgi:DNA polymerase gamma 1